ncbi:imm11 family protein [Leptospira kirschneri]|uniref:imm11 family protein n=1 Tax=Leptospira kirschneri TaxID=29507 RepID=UPI0003054B04|nr:DUF1629 domain-containing protein [Leptospira kirschneri]KON76388.1 Uncharacterized protein NV38_0002960 [Leptospira kirschneri serovar Mozdok]KPZ76892.1 hypothetical protein APS47_14395 [Leptospira kirschneri serovar Mozdok]NDK05504.1 hypothetical protein [Leptospira kirschneri serovar Mozdok]
MNYYILEEVTYHLNVPYIGDLPEELDRIDVMTGKKIEILNLPIRVPIRIDYEDEIVYPDMMTADLPLFSEKMRNSLDRIGVENIQYYPVELFENQTGETKANYYMSILPISVECLKSGINKSPAGRLILKNPIIDSTKILGLRLFRLGEEPSLIIIDSIVKDTLTNAQLNGVSFIPLEEYMSS